MHKTRPLTNIVTAKIFGNRTRVDQAVWDLRSVLECSIRQYEVGGNLGYRESSEPLPFYDCDRLGRLVFATGLLPRVKTKLESLGYTVRIVDRRRFGRKYRTDKDVVDGAEDDERELLQTILTEPRGQIEVATNKDRLRYITLICRLYRRAQVIIPVAKKRDAWTLWRNLNRSLDRKVGIASSRKWKTKCPILVCTYAVLASIAPKDWQIALFPEVEEIASKLARQAINERLPTQRVYGFATPGIVRKCPSQMIVEAMTGPVIYSTSPTPVPVNVIVMKNRSSKIKNTRNPLHWKRRAYWRNDQRNDSIAEIAKAVANGTKDRLIGANIIALDDQPRVTILVESVEHGWELHRWLTDWRLMTAVPDVEGRTTRRGKKTRGGTIMTQVRAAATKIKADVVIRATGGNDPILIRGFPRNTGSDSNQAMVIDFADDADDKTSRATTRRIREYREREWTVKAMAEKGEVEQP